MGQAAAGRPADLNRFEVVAHQLAIVIGDSATDVANDAAQGGAEGHFDQAGVGHVASKGKGLGSGEDSVPGPGRLQPLRG